MFDSIVISVWGHIGGEYMVLIQVQVEWRHQDMGHKQRMWGIYWWENRNWPSWHRSLDCQWCCICESLWNGGRPWYERLRGAGVSENGRGYWKLCAGWASGSTTYGSYRVYIRLSTWIHLMISCEYWKLATKPTMSHQLQSMLLIAELLRKTISVVSTPTSTV